MKAHNAGTVELGSERGLPTTSRGSEKAESSRDSVGTYTQVLVALGGVGGLLWFPLLTPELFRDRSLFE